MTIKSEHDGVSTECTTTVSGDLATMFIENIVGEAIYKSMGGVIQGNTARIELLGYFVDLIERETVVQHVSDSYAWVAMEMMVMYLTDKGDCPIVEKYRDLFDGVIEAARQFSEARQAHVEALNAARVSGNGTTRTPQEADGAGEARG